MEGEELAAIKNKVGNNIFVKGQTYGSRLILLQDLRVVDVNIVGSYGEAQVEVTLEKMSKLIKGNKIKSYKIPIKVEVNGSNELIKCYSSAENAIETSVEQACNSIGGVLDPATSKCDLIGFNPVTALKNSDGVSTEHLNDFFTDKVTTILDPRFVNYTDPMKCPNGEYIEKINADGTLVCKPLPGGSFPPVNCAWTSEATAWRPAWATATCPAGKELRGHYFKTSNNRKENMEIEIIFNQIRGRRPNDGNFITVKAYCCDP